MEKLLSYRVHVDESCLMVIYIVHSEALARRLLFASELEFISSSVSNNLNPIPTFH